MQGCSAGKILATNRVVVDFSCDMAKAEDTGRSHMLKAQVEATTPRGQFATNEEWPVTMAKLQVGVVYHPISGEAYAVRVVGHKVISAAGPMNQGESMDADCLDGWLDNNEETATIDAQWLSAAFGTRMLSTLSVAD